MRRLLFSTLFLLSLTGALNCAAQSTVNTYSVKTWFTPPPPPFSPVVQSDGRITFRLKAAHAQVVNLLFGEWNIKPQPLTKDTAGVWSITINPVVPGIYSYVFSVDGVQTLDPVNPVTKIGTQIYSSIVEVPGHPDRFDEVQNTPHGQLVQLRYFSTPLHQPRGLYVYLPAAYFKNPAATFPVLYLRHGGGDNESSWTQAAGRADIILDNLVASGKAKPCIIVMTNGLTDGTWGGGSSPKGLQQLDEELMKDVVPLVEKDFRVKKGRDWRAIAGLSMGGGQAFIIGLRNINQFAWIGEFSAGLLSDKDFKISDYIRGGATTQWNRQLRLLWIGCGKDDPRFPGHLNLVNDLKNQGINHVFYPVPGGHEWTVWRLELAAFMEKLFK